MAVNTMALYLEVINLYAKATVIKDYKEISTRMQGRHNNNWMDELEYQLAILEVELGKFDAMLLWILTHEIQSSIPGRVLAGKEHQIEYNRVRSDKLLEIDDKKEEMVNLQACIDGPTIIVTKVMPTLPDITKVDVQSVARTSEAIRLREEKENTKDDIEDVEEQINVLMAPVDKLSYENLALGRSIETQMKSLSYTIALINRNDEYFKRDSWEHAMANQPGTTPPYDQYVFVMDYSFLTPDVEAQYVASIPILETSIANDKATATNLIIAHDDLLATVQPDIDTLNALL